MVTLSIGDLISIGGLVITALGFAFFMGRLAARVDSLEAWRGTMPAEFDKIHAALRELRLPVGRHV